MREENLLFSVAMCVYGGDKPEWFDCALKSIINQTVKPNEIVLVIDGSISDAIQDIVKKYICICQQQCIVFNVIRLDNNYGHGIARRISLQHCSNDIVALMDADDICVSNRFEDELFFLKQTGADIIGGDISEFIGEVNNVIGYRRVPKTDKELKEYIKKRCPFNQVTVMFRKEMYTNAGGYLDWYCEEDYYLWLRMMLQNAVFANTGTVLVNVRVGDEMYQRRGGIKYFLSEAKLQKYMLNKKIIGFFTYVSNVTIRFILQVLMPNKIRGWIFQNFARERKL